MFQKFVPFSTFSSFEFLNNTFVFNKIMKVAIAIFALVALLSGETLAIKYRNCGKSKIHSIEFEGTDNNGRTAVFKRGNDYSLKIRYTAGLNANNLKSTWYGVFSGQDVEWDQVTLGNGCDTVSGGCPIRRGQSYEYVERITAPLDAPKVNKTNLILKFHDNFN